MKLISKNDAPKSSMLKAASLLSLLTFSKVCFPSLMAVASISPQVAARIPLSAPFTYRLSPKFSIREAISMMMTKEGSTMPKTETRAPFMPFMR